MFIGQFLKGSNMGPIKKFNRGKLRNYFGISRLYYLHNNKLRIVLKSMQKFDSRVKFFLIVVSLQTSSASCSHFI